MKTIVITKPGESDVLQLKESKIPEIKESEVLIKVKAAGVNRPDIAQRQGTYPAPPGVSAEIPGLEVAGIIEKIGSEVKKLRVGDKICALLAGGGYAEYVAAPEGQCMPIPKGLNFIEAASLPETFFTVWSNVFDRAGFEAGDRFLIHGGTSGIGVAAIQMVKALGGIVYTTVGSKEKCDFAESLGATKAINYKEADFEKEIKEIEKDGIDIILDMIGGGYANKNINVLKTKGRLIMINAVDGGKAEINLIQVMIKRLVITGSTLRRRSTEFKKTIAGKLEKHIWPHLESGEIKPIVFKTFPLAEASLAHELLESGKHIGKVVLIP